ncbi:MAG: zinc ribbon domain-containing protein [Candidatus Lokiarchaeota archaeon]|nr:zinc ribbon domain-containing protein [Candidatus Lokiarchaeota archaeon]
MESIQRIFSKLLKELNLPTPVVPARKEGSVEKQQKDIQIFKDLLTSNLVGEMKVWGGNFDEEQWKEAKAKLPDAIKNLQQEAKEKEIKAYFDIYAKVMRKFLDAHCMAKAEVKTMPFKTVYMQKIPKIDQTDKGMEINDKPVGLIAELPYQVERSCAYGEMKDKKPLFAPIIGSLDLTWSPPAQKPAPDAKEYVEDVTLQAAIFEAMDKQTTVNSVWRYENYGRKGEPICDKLMENQDLMVAMERVASEVDIKEFKGNASVCSLFYAVDGRTIVGVVDYEGVQKNAFEAIFKLCAYLEDVPRAAGAAPGGAAPAGGGMVTAGGQSSLPTWTEEELAKQPQFAASAGPSLPTWTEEELETRQDKFTGGGGVNLPVWTEDELAELSKSSGAQGLNLPEWQDEGMQECPKCGYSLQPDWDECPVCSAKIERKAAPAQKPAEKPAAKPAAQKPAPGP